MADGNEMVDAAFEDYMEAQTRGAWHQWPEHQRLDARQDFRAGWDAAWSSALEAAGSVTARMNAHPDEEEK